MFTGIVEEVGTVVAAPANRLVIAADRTLSGLKAGGSIAVNGVCLTAADFNARSFTVDVMPETLRRTNLGQLRNGDRVNLERPLALGGELGGHLVQGHIDGTGEIAAVTREGGALLVRILAPPEIMSFTVPQGFIAVDGASLTIVSKDDHTFAVSLVDFTRRHTILGEKKSGDMVNLEIDIIAKYVAQLHQPRSSSITFEFLKEHGFIAN